MSESTASDLPAGWQIAVSQNPNTGLWHWIAWQGTANFGDPEFVKCWEAGYAQTAPTRDEAVQAASLHALDQQAGWVDVPMFDTGANYAE